jgi:hypothetical protein
MPIRDEDGHRAMQAAGKAWKAIKTHRLGYNAAMGALLEEYGFGNALERHRSQVSRADLLRCMDYLSEIEKWRHDAKASVLLSVERHRKHRYPDHTGRQRRQSAPKFSPLRR